MRMWTMHRCMIVDENSKSCVQTRNDSPLAHSSLHILLAQPETCLLLNRSLSLLVLSPDLAVWHRPLQLFELRRPVS